MRKYRQILEKDGKRYSPDFNCHRCRKRVRERLFSTKTGPLHDAVTLEKHEHDYDFMERHENAVAREKLARTGLTMKACLWRDSANMNPDALVRVTDNDLIAAVDEFRAAVADLEQIDGREIQ